MLLGSKFASNCIETFEAVLPQQGARNTQGTICTENRGCGVNPLLGTRSGLLTFRNLSAQEARASGSEGTGNTTDSN